MVLGRSAGAQLAMRLAYQEGPSSIRGVVNYYGPVDLTEGWRRPPHPDPLHVREILETFIGGTPDEKPEHYRHASPITWVSRASAPTLSIYGRRDHVVEARFGRMLDAALKKAGATSVLLEVPWSEHSFDAVPAGIGTQVSLAYTERFIAWRSRADRRLNVGARRRDDRLRVARETAALRHRACRALPAKTAPKRGRITPTSSVRLWSAPQQQGR